MRLFSFICCFSSAERSRDTSVRGQHGGHTCGLSKQIALFFQLTPPRETHTPSADPGRCCPKREQDGRGQQTTVPVSARHQGGASGESTVSRSVCVASRSYPPLQPHCAPAEMYARPGRVRVFGGIAVSCLRESVCVDVSSQPANCPPAPTLPSVQTLAT